MNDRDIGWMAGVLDGEGCIHASSPFKKEKDRDKGWRHHFHIRVIITQRPNALLEKFGRLLRELGIEYRYRDACSKSTAEIALTKKSEIVKLLTLLVGDLSCKKRSAEAVIGYLTKWPESQADGWHGSSEEKIRDYIKVYNILKKQKCRSPFTVETIRCPSEVDEDIVRHS